MLSLLSPSIQILPHSEGLSSDVASAMRPFWMPIFTTRLCAFCFFLEKSIFQFVFKIYDPVILVKAYDINLTTQTLGKHGCLFLKFLPLPHFTN